MFFKDQRGFTTVEAMCVIVILAVVIVGVLDIYTKGILFWDKGEQSAEVKDNLRIGLDRMSRELRQAKQLTANTTSKSATNDILEFINYDNTTVRYEVIGSSLKRRAGYGNFEPLSNYINGSGGLRIECYPPGDGNPISATLVKLTLSGCTGLTDTYSLSTSVRLRKPK